MSVMKHVEGEIGTEDWEFHFGELDKVIALGVTEAVKQTLAQFPPYLALNLSERGNPAATLVLSLSLEAFQARSASEPVWELPIKTLIDDCYGEDLDQDGKVHPSEIESMILLRDKLAELVASVESRIP